MKAFTFLNGTFGRRSPIQTAFAITGLAGLLLIAGCGQKTAKLSSADAHQFDNAPPELAQKWQTVLNADKSNDWVTARVALYDLSREKLTPEQEQAVGNEMLSLKQRMQAAAEKGDPAALKAYEELRDHPVNRR